jgi:hypothetical protein
MIETSTEFPYDLYATILPRTFMYSGMQDRILA